MKMKVGEKELLKEVAEDLVQYLMSGPLPIKLETFASDNSLEIYNLDSLLRIHFLLTDELADFMKELEGRVRKIKTTVTSKKSENNGAIRGRISWKDTISTRMSRNPKDNSIFVCIEREKEYDVPENLVLKRLLQVIKSILDEDLLPNIGNDPTWISNWISGSEKNGGKPFKEALETVFIKNVYIRRVSLEKNEVTQRMIERTKRSRQPLYREAAELLDRYRRIMNYEMDEKEAKELLKNTFIKPDRTEVLFELYWAIKIMKSAPDNMKWKKHLIIDRGENLIAEGRLGGTSYLLYHNSTADFSFHEKISEAEEDVCFKGGYATREIAVLKAFETLTGVDKTSIWGGRPDIILVKIDGEDVNDILLCEVKYTGEKNYALTGLRELLEYMALIKESGGKYLENHENLFENMKKLRGVLLTDRIDGFSINESDSIKMVMFSNHNEKELKEKIWEKMLGEMQESEA